jgi:hypothetical protein
MGHAHRRQQEQGVELEVHGVGDEGVAAPARVAVHPGKDPLVAYRPEAEAQMVDEAGTGQFFDIAIYERIGFGGRAITHLLSALSVLLMALTLIQRQPHPP